jgi:hypothetical protein
MNRRKLILSGIGGVAAVLAARAGLASPEHGVIRVLRKRLDYLQLDEAGVHRFAKDVIDKQAISSFRLRVLDYAGPLYDDTDLSRDSAIGGPIGHGEDRVVTQYLISSDFFIHGADTNRVVRYLGWFNPLAACGNPFARPVDGITA